MQPDVISAAPPCTCRSSPAATRAARRPARTRSVEAGIGRVVVASDDPSEHANGRGLGILRDDGIEVVVADGELATRRGCSTSRFASTRGPAVRGCCSSRRCRSTARSRPAAATPSGSPASRAASWPIGGARNRRRRRRDRDRAGGRSAADRPVGPSRCAASRAAWSSTRSARLPIRPSWSRDSGRAR